MASRYDEISGRAEPSSSLGNPVGVEGTVHLVLDVFGMPVRLGGSCVGTPVLLLPLLYDLELLLLYLYNGTITMLLI